MAVALTGTPVNIDWATGTDPATQNVTIPSDATAVYLFWAYWNSGASGYGLSTITLNGNNPDQTHESAGTGSLNGTGVAAWYNPSTGSQTIDVSWDQTQSTGVVCSVYFVKGGNTTAWRDADSNATVSSVANSVTLTSSSSDLVIKHDAKDTTTSPGNTSGWTSDLNGSDNGMAYRSAHIFSSGSTQACPSENENYSSIVAISIQESSGTTNVNATTDALVLTEQNPTLTYDLQAGVDALTLTEYAATITQSANVQATSQALTLTEFSPVITYDVQAGVDTLTLTEFTPALLYDLQVATDALVITTYRATIAGGAPIEERIGRNRRGIHGRLI